MKELEYKHRIIGVMGALGFDVQAHEDKLYNFIPDLSFAFGGRDGWIEVKYAQRPPKTLGSISHYTYGQQQWLIDRGANGSGSCFLLVGTPDHNFLWRWDALATARVMLWDDAVTRCVVEPEKSIHSICNFLVCDIST
jgi:hypothetical protein